MTILRPPRPINDLYDVVREYRRQLAGRNLSTMEAIALFQDLSWKVTKDLLEQLTADAAAEAGVGEEGELGPTPQWVFRQVRFQQIVEQLNNSYSNFLEYLRDAIRGEQQAAAELSQRMVEEAIEAQIPEIIQSFSEVNIDALREMVLQTMPGPVQDVLRKYQPAAVEAVREALVNGIVQGYSPARVAREVRAALGTNGIRALTIVRTEMMRAFREASRVQMMVNGHLLEGWVWESARNSRTCPICWAMQGTIFPFTGEAEPLIEGITPIPVEAASSRGLIPMYTHVNCRCVMVPRTRAYADILDNPTIPDNRPPVVRGQEAFSKLSPEQQRAILGASRFELYQQGMPLADMIYERDDPVWGGVRGLRPLRQLSAGFVK